MLGDNGEEGSTKSELATLVSSAISEKLGAVLQTMQREEESRLGIHMLSTKNVEYEKDDDVFSRHYNGQREQVRSNNMY